MLDATTGAAIRDGYFASQAAWCGFDQLGVVSKFGDPHAPHLAAVLKTVDAGGHQRGPGTEYCWTAITAPEVCWEFDC